MKMKLLLLTSTSCNTSFYNKESSVPFGAGLFSSRRALVFSEGNCCSDWLWSFVFACPWLLPVSVWCPAQILQVPVMSMPVQAFKMLHLLTHTLCTAIFKGFTPNQIVWEFILWVKIILMCKDHCSPWDLWVCLGSKCVPNQTNQLTDS